MLREKRREEFKTTEIKRDENENILSTFLSKVFLAVFPRNTLTLSAILSTEKNYYTSHANSSGVHSGRTRVILFFIDQLPRQFLQSIHSSSTTACSFFHHFFFFFFTTFSCIEPCGMPMLRRHEGSRESRRTFVLRGKNYFLNQLAVTSSLKTLKSAYLKCVVRSKRRRVYSSSTEYVWLL